MLYEVITNYLFCKIARSQGVNADLFLDPKFLDITATSLPFWEEVEYQSKTMPSAEDVMDAWQLPSFVKVAKWSLEFYTAQLARFDFRGVITSYSIHYTKLYEHIISR